METRDRAQHAPPGPGETIPVPPDFPVTWRTAAAENLFWQRDRMHFPDPLPPLVTTLFIDEVFSQAFGYAADAHALPISLAACAQNGYFYQTAIPKGHSPEEMEELGAKAQEALGSAMGRQLERWNTETLPEVREHIAAWDRMDLAAASPSQLRAYLDETVERTLRLWQLHFLTVIPGFPSVSIFEDMCRDLFADDPEFVPHQLIQGIPTKITEMGLALWGLSRQAREMPSVRQILEEEAAADVIPALVRTEEGREFLADFHGYLAKFGQRGDSALCVAEVTWIEDPTPAIKMLKDYVGQDDRDLQAEAEALATEREAAIALARTRLEGFPEQVRGQFEYLLDAAQQGIYLAEEHNYHIDFCGMYRVRVVTRELGQRLVEAGTIEDAEDVYFLTLDELRAALDTFGESDLRAAVTARREEHARQRAMQPPPVLGAMPPGPPPDDPLSLAFMKFFGGPPQISEEPNTVQGTAGSPGVVRGTARVLRSLADADRLQRGDIIVAETTAVPWTPHFATAAGIVTDTGGTLSHSAVTAREYGIPAVVGATIATAVIRDGQMIEVDGFTGLVRILDAV